MIKIVKRSLVFIFLCLVSAFILPLVFVSAAVPVPQDDGRDQLINDELEAAAGRISAKDLEQPREYTRENQKYLAGDSESQTLLTSPEESPSENYYQKKAFENYTKSPHQFELGTEVYWYKYTERIGVKDSGFKGGLTGAYQYRISQNEVIESWSDFLHETSKINIFRFEERMSYGEVKYDGSGTWSGIPDWNFETRALLGMEMPFDREIIITPYLGLGHRYLFNEFSVLPAQVVDGQQYYSGYDRESTYVYLPLGLEAQKQLTMDWSLTLKSEVDILLWGKQVSHLENMVDQTGANPGFDKLQNTQKNGIGFRASLRLTRKTDRLDIFFEPFLRYWHIRDSEFSFETISGSYICTGNLCSGGIEPDNKTWECGLSMGAKF